MSNDTIYRRIMRITGTEWCRNRESVPEARTLRYVTEDGCDRVIASNNDGFELWLGTPHKWDCHLNENEVRKLLRWIIVDWYAKARWFGLRRPIYYWALRKDLELWRARMGARR